MNEEANEHSRRDMKLARALCAATDTARGVIYEWMQQELNELAVTLDTIESTSSGPIKATAKEQLERVRRIDRIDLNEYSEYCEKRVDEIESGIFTDPFDAYLYLQEGMYQLEKTARILLIFRRQAERLTDGIDAPSEDEEPYIESDGDEEDQEYNDS